ncbi:MAG: hypothetical protein ACYC4U_11795 [Pirellulaceae bacterium]
MRNDLVLLAIVSLAFLCPLAPAQEAEIPTLYAEVQYMRVPEGGEELYMKVEKAWKKLHAIRKEAGIVNQWLVCKVTRTDGPPGDYNYTVIHIFDSWDKLKSLYPSGLFEGKLSLSDEEQDAINRTRESRKMIGTQLWELDDVADPSRLNHPDFDKTLILSLMKSKDAGRHIALEKEVWKNIWARAVEEGFRANWHLWACRYPGGEDREFDEVAVHLFPKGEPRKSVTSQWWEQTLPKIFPDKSQEEHDKLMEETRHVRDIPITEEWEIVLTLDTD